MTCPPIARAALAALALLAAGLAGAQPGGPPDPAPGAPQAVPATGTGKIEGLRRYGRSLAQARRFGEAIKAYQALLALAPGDLPAAVAVAQLQAWSGHYDEAIVGYRAVLQRRPGDPGLTSDLADVLTWAKRLEEAQLLYEQVLSARPGHLEALKGLARVQALRGDQAGAAGTLDEALRRYPAEADLHRERGRLLASRGDLAGAAKALEQAARLAPDDREVARQLAETWQRKQDWPRAVAAWLRVAQLEPDSPAAHVALGRAYLASGRSVLARDHAELARRMSPTDAGVLALVEALDRERGVAPARSVAELLELLVHLVLLPLVVLVGWRSRRLLARRPAALALVRWVVPGVLVANLLARLLRDRLEGWLDGRLLQSATDVVLFLGLGVAFLAVLRAGAPVREFAGQVVLALGAHPDDIELGCAGFLFKLKASGARVYGLTFTRGERGADRPERRVDESRRAAELMGLDGAWVLDFPDTGLQERVPEIKTAIEAKIRELGATVVLTHTDVDVHGDHRAVSAATREAARAVPTVLCYEDVSTTAQFTPNLYVDVSDYLDQHLQACAVHRTQGHRTYMDPAVLRGRAAHRGLQVGRAFALAFRTLSLIRERMATLHALFWAFGLVVFALGIQGALYFPLTIAYEVWKWRTLRRLPRFQGRVSVVVPAFNEARTIRASLETLLESAWPDLEVVVVDDGSTDGTAHRVQDLADAGRLTLLRQANGGKARALDAGIARATGEVVLYTDADSLFLRDTVAQMARWFADPSVDAVCGNDAPLRAGTALQKLLVVTTHIGTGYVRRALSLIRCLPIISGNLGAVRRSVLAEVGGFEPIWGEDLELTWRLQLAGKRIVFDPEPIVLADCPSTFDALWRQRVRWVRSYLKIARRYRGRFLARDAWPFSLYLPLNFVNMAVVPLLQTALLFVLPWAVAQGWLGHPGALDVVSWLGLGFFYAVAVYAILLDREWPDLLYLPWGLLILPVSYFLNAVVLYSWWKEMSRAEEKWEKLRRLEPPPPAGARRWGLAVALLAVAAGAAGLTALLLPRERVVGPAGPPASWSGAEGVRPAFSLGLSTHFDAWGDWRDATRRLVDRPLVGLTDVVGIGAGRSEWAYFRWKGHQDQWSNHQKGAPEDLLATATQELRARGFRIAAFVDLYAPAWTASHPGTAAIRADGTPHPEQVALSELADGPFGDLAVEMVEAIAAGYPVDAIDLTELAYRDTSYGAGDLASFRTFSGRADWPRDWRGRPDVEDPAVWTWKSTLVERFVTRATAAAHRHGKQLWVDVAASWKDLTRDGKDYGHDYARLERAADRIVVWNYHALEGLPASASADLARRLVATRPAGRWSMSVGLWGPGGKPVTPEELGATLAAALEGGAREVWVTPNDQLTDAHWNALLQRWLVPVQPPSGGGPRPAGAR